MGCTRESFRVARVTLYWNNALWSYAGAAVAKFKGTKGNDDFTGTAKADTFDLTKGGDDKASGGNGNDKFVFGAAFTAADHINGGAGNDTLSLNGDYSTRVTFAASTMVGVETITLAAGHDYNLKTNNANVASGASLKVNGSALGAGDVLTFDGSKETNGTFNLIGGAGNDLLTGGVKNDTFDLTRGGDDTAAGGKGNDLFNMGLAFDSSDIVNGGNGNDTLTLTGVVHTDTLGVTLSGTNMSGVENLTLAGSGFSILDSDHTFGANTTSFTIDGSALNAVEALTFSGYDSNHFAITGGTADDSVTTTTFMLYTPVSGLPENTPGFFFDGGAGNDTFTLQATQYDDIGEYPPAVITISTASLHNIETLALSPFGAGSGEIWNVTEANGTVASGATLTIQVNAATTDDVTFNGAAEQDGSFDFKGANISGDISFTGGHMADTFELGGNLAAAMLNGGGGSDTLVLTGDYSAGAALDGLSSIETVKVMGTSAYLLSLTNADLPGSGAMTFDGSGLTTSGHFDLDLTALTSGAITFIGAAIGGDTVTIGSATVLNAGTFDGGSSFGDELDLAGDFSGGVTLGASNVRNFANIVLSNGHDYNLTMENGIAVNGETVFINAGTLGSGHTLAVDGTGITNLVFNIDGGAGNDAMSGGNVGDTFDLINGGHDTINYTSASQSDGSYDSINYFGADDKINLPFTVSAVNSVSHSVNDGGGGTFTSDLEVACAGHMTGAHDAVIVHAQSGLIYMVIDWDGSHDFNPGNDLVVSFLPGTADLTTGNFESI